MSVLSFERFSVSCDAASVREVAGPMLGAMRSAPGALWADLLAAEEGYVLLSEWRTAGDLDAFEASTVADAFARALDPVLAGERTKRRFSSG